MPKLVDPVVFAQPHYEAMAASIANELGAELGEVERRVFPDGEHYQRVVTQIADRDAILVGGTVDETATLTMFDLGCAISKYGARRLDLIIPYYGYSTMERSTIPGEVITGKTRSRVLSAIPAAAAGNRAWFLDLHAEGIQHYCEGHMVARHIYAKPVLLPVMRELGGEGMVLASTDAGRAKWVQSLSNELGCAAAIIIKRRLSGDETMVSSVSCDVEGRRVVIYDDMIRTGGSLLGAAKTYLDAGATAVDVVATHGVLPGDAFKRLRDSGLLGTIACTDSHPRAMELESEGLRIIPVAPLLAQKVGDGSVS
ncbi:MAG: ribose-phosphate diphosphokinase [Planctomycetota bacterium]|jgi:ribose-phosphate pyrophosphokinase|nr:ribose-phosphate diphosphokinase [Planctomycetota bacterium]